MSRDLKTKRAQSWLRKKSRRGNVGFPVATLAFYGPDGSRASKLVVGIIESDGAEVDPLRKWFGEDGDLRRDMTVLDEAVAFLKENSVRSVGMVDKIIGCPHEEGVDYPEGEACPQCPYWAGRDRWTE